MPTATEPITVTISHRLGREEAKRRIDGGLGAIRAEVAPYVRTFDYAWSDDRLDFHASVMMQTIIGRIEVYDEFIKIELVLPWLLHFLGNTIAKQVETRGAALLEAPKDKG